MEPLEIEFNAATARWEANEPKQRQRLGLRLAGFLWDARNRVWYALDDDTALRGMELPA